MTVTPVPNGRARCAARIAAGSIGLPLAWFRVKSAQRRGQAISEIRDCNNIGGKMMCLSNSAQNQN
jgi:hypothetical protein